MSTWTPSVHTSILVSDNLVDILMDTQLTDMQPPKPFYREFFERSIYFYTILFPVFRLRCGHRVHLTNMCY